MEKISREEAEKICNDENIRYLRKFLDIGCQEFLGKSREETVKLLSDGYISSVREGDYQIVVNCLRAMNHYGKNRWWLSNDKCVLAYFQIHTNVLLISDSVYIQAASYLLDRRVDINEIRKPKQLMKEGEEKFGVGGWPVAK